MGTSIFSRADRPVLVAPDAKIEVAARRIVWGKCMNSGQSCTAPDYVLVPRDKEERLVQACGKALTEFYGEASLEHMHNTCSACQMDWGEGAEEQYIMAYLGWNFLWVSASVCDSHESLELTHLI